MAIQVNHQSRNQNVLSEIFFATLLFWQQVFVSKFIKAGQTNDKIPDITAFSEKFIVDNEIETELCAYTSYIKENENKNVMFGVGLWVDDSGTHYGEKELKDSGPTSSSIFTNNANYNQCKKNPSSNPTSYRCTLTFPTTTTVRRGGVKYTWTERNNYTASASMVFLSKKAKVIAERRTITTSIGETIELKMSLDGDIASSLQWKKDGGSDIIEWEGLRNVTIENVQENDAGIYECFPEGQRHEGEHAIVRVIVRECPRGKWLPPDCKDDCPVCYNGGVCSVQFGSCICPPGFTGINCEEACGDNKWGRDCTILCQHNGNCKGKFFCPPDPFGCSCMSGYSGLHCNKECETKDTGKYGPGCRLDCRCNVSECQPSEGCNINVNCHAGYTGTRCLQALPVLSDAPSIEFTASGILVVWTAWDKNYDFGDINASSYVLKYWETASADKVKTVGNIMKNQTEINISSIDYNQSYTVTVSVITDINGKVMQGLASPVTTIDPIEPPSFSSNPCNFIRLANFSTIVTCNIWSFDAHNGMGIVQGYIIEYWNVNTPNIPYSVCVDEPLQSQNYTVLLPEVYVYYSFEVVVMVNYEHKGVKTGTRSSLLIIPKVKVPDITAFSIAYIVNSGIGTEMRAYTGRVEGDNDNVIFGVGLWVDDNGTHYGENELVNQENTVGDSIFTNGTTFEKCKIFKDVSILCWLKFPHTVDVRRVGVKYMWTKFKGYNASASMVFLANEAKVRAEHRTITTSVGETVELVMTLNGVESSSLRWKKDGGSNIVEWERLSNVTIVNIRKKDAGIYECYPEGQRNLGQHAILRLLVRECPRGKFLPPDCEIDCPVCYNGGVCSTQFGSCICPPGFTGDNCEKACGFNKWGRDCTLICSSSTPGCPNILFCPPDPFGCSCMSGFGDLKCKECDTKTTGKYGPGCLLDCHCNATECQPSEGCKENATCHSGYIGTRCLERDPDVECPDGFYGPQCTKICHCRNSSKCNRNNGTCLDGDVCEDGWAGLGCQQVLPALSDAPHVKMFPNTCNIEIGWSSWSLDNDYGRGNVHSYQLEYWPTSHISDLVVLNTTMDTKMNISRAQMNNNTEYSFTVKVVTDVEGVLVVGKPSPPAVQIYLPALSNAPLVKMFANYVTISWSIWNFYKDYGCGTVNSYQLKFWPTTDTSDVVVLNVTIGTETNISCADMNYNTEYSFTVKVLTDVVGVLFVGKPSPLAFYQIYPPVLQNPPTNISRSSLGINVNWTEWEFNRDDGIGCVTGYVVEWWDAVAAWNISNDTFNGEPSEGILIPDIPYYTTLVLQIKMLYNKRNSEVIGLPSPLLVIFREQCPYGWKQFKETCYLFGENAINCDDANSFCQKESAKLVSITSREEKDFVSSQSSNISHEYCWIGDWNWTQDGEGKCTQFYPTSVSWSDGPCESNQTRAVCEKDVQKFGCLDGSWHGYKDNCYRHYSNLSLWPTAVSFCRELRNADLASIHSQKEDEFIQTIIQYYDGYSWIGLNSSDEEHWSDGTYVNYSVIETGAEGGCVVYSQENHVFSWKTQLCASSPHAYVCKDMRGNIYCVNCRILNCF